MAFWQRNIVSFKTIISIITGVVIMQAYVSAIAAAEKTDVSLIGTTEKSVRGSDGKFDSNGSEPEMSFKSFISMAGEYFFKRNSRTPDTSLPVRQADMSFFNREGHGQLNATWLGHSSLMINIDGFRIVTDPVLEKRVSILGPSRYNGEVPVDVDDIPDIDVVIISHDHYDHLNKYSIQKLHGRTSRFIVPLNVGKRLIAWGVPEEKVVELSWWQEYKINSELLIAATPAQHFSGRGIGDRNETLWASWVIGTKWHTVFFSGDSGYFGGFRQIGEKYGPFDMTFIECGAYGESWPGVHMFPEQTVQAHLDLNGGILHPIHWGTFNLAFHPWFEPMERLTAAAWEEGVTVATPVVGGSTVFGDTPRSERWWEDDFELTVQVAE